MVLAYIGIAGIFNSHSGLEFRFIHTMIVDGSKQCSRHRQWKCVVHMSQMIPTRHRLVMLIVTIREFTEPEILANEIHLIYTEHLSFLMVP